MRRREIFLDFTSLLDVVMILLFFFIIFATFETKEMQAEMQKQQSELQQQQEEYALLTDEAERKLADADKALEQADTLLEEVKAAENRAGENIQGINEFISGKSLKLKLNMNSGNWKLDVYYKDELLKEIPNGTADEMSVSFTEMLAEKGCQTDDTILCEFHYNAAEGGTASAYKELQRVFEKVQEEYTHLFFSETDISMYEED